MATEDFLTYTEYDVNDDIEVSSAKVDFVTYYGTRINRVYKDFGAGHFSGDFEHQVEVQYTEDDSVHQYGYPGWVTAWMLSSENSGRIQDIIDAGESAIGIAFVKPWNSHNEDIYLFEIYGGVMYTAPRVGTTFPDAPRYGRVSRSGNTLTWTIYTDDSYTTVLATRTLTLHGTPSYRYVNIGGGFAAASYICFITGFTRNLDISAVLPTATTNPATSVVANSTTLNGTLDDDGGEACDCGFEWGETIAYGNTTPTQSRTTGQTFAQTISGLDPKKTYHFRALATNSAGTGHGDDRTFTTLAVAPTVATNPAIDINNDSATLKGKLTYDGGEACNCGFEYGETEAYGTTTPTQSKVTGEAFSQPITGLDPNKTYHFRAIATNSAGTSHGADRTFKTLVSAPAVTTKLATGLGAVLATLNGTLDDDIGEACECGFEWGLDTDYGVITPTETKTAVDNFSQVIGGLIPNTVYHFRAFATNSFGTGYGADRTFTTALIISRAYALARREL